MNVKMFIHNFCFNTKCGRNLLITSNIHLPFLLITETRMCSVEKPHFLARLEWPHDRVQSNGMEVAVLSRALLKAL